MEGPVCFSDVEHAYVSGMIAGMVMRHFVARIASDNELNVVEFFWGGKWFRLMVTEVKE